MVIGSSLNGEKKRELALPKRLFLSAIKFYPHKNRVSGKEF